MAIKITKTPPLRGGDSEVLTNTHPTIPGDRDGVKRSKQFSQLYHQYIQSQQWRDTRKQILEIDAKTCQKCGRISRLQVHHKTYKRLGGEYVEDLITLCDKCHEKLHRNKDKAKRKEWKLRKKYGIIKRL